MGEEGDGRDRGGRGEASREGEPDAAGLRLLLLRLDSALGVERRHYRGIERERERQERESDGVEFFFSFLATKKHSFSLCVFSLFLSKGVDLQPPTHERWEEKPAARMKLKGWNESSAAFRISCWVKKLE